MRKCNILSILPEDTGAYHRGVVFSDDQGIYVADIRVFTVEFSNFNYKTIYSSSNGPVGEIRFMTVDAVDRSVVFVANGTDIYSMNIDVANPQPKHIISSTNPTDDITGRFHIWYYLRIEITILRLYRVMKNISLV